MLDPIDDIANQIDQTIDNYIHLNLIFITNTLIQN